MRVIIKKATVLNKEEFGYILALKGEKGTFELGGAFFTREGDRPAIQCSFKPFDPQAKTLPMHAVSIIKEKNTIKISTLSGNFLALEAL